VLKVPGLVHIGWAGGLIALLVLVAGCSSTTQLGVSSPSPAAPRCTLTSTVDSYDGFHIGVPDGWSLFTLDGMIFVSKGPASAEVTVVRPALSAAGLTPAAYLATALEKLRQHLMFAGITMTTSSANTSAQMPTAALSLQSTQGPLTGEARVATLPYPTAHSSTLLVLIASWAPATQFAAERPMLTGIANCYGPQAGTLYQVVRDQVFTYSIAAGWQPRNETQDTIDIVLGNDATVSYAATFAALSTGVNSPQTLLTWAFGKIGVQVGQTLFSAKLPDQPLSAGAVQGQEYVEFTGTLSNGSPIHGLVNVVSTTGPGGTGGVIRLGVASTSQWNAVNGALIHMMFSIQHSITQDLQQYEQLSRQWQAFGQQVQGFDYALTGVDLVNDPTTGATFEAPYNTYNPSGPAGPGYYSPAGTKLVVQTP
jgi:hypothetical protein